MPPRFRVYIAASVDGYIADAKGGVDWLDPFAAENFGYRRFFGGIHTVVMGRRSFDQVLGFGAWPYAGRRSVVLTRRKPPPDPPREVAFRDVAAADLAAELRAGGAGDVWVMGGADTIGQFMDARCVDALELFVIPLLLGRGVPLFPEGDGPRPLTLQGARPYAQGVVRLSYRMP